MDISNAMVIGIGLGTVFVGLICLILICYIMSAVVNVFTKKEKKKEAPSPVTSPAPVAVANKGEFVSAIAAAIAEDLGTDVTGIRIKSIKRV